MSYTISKCWPFIWMKIQVERYKLGQYGFLLFTLLFLFSFSIDVHAANNIGAIADNVLKSFESLAKLITASSYLAGLGFAIGAIMKFKQHKDNPTQIPIGTPIALVFIAAALLFLPSILGVTGATVFGDAGGTVAGPGGTVFGTK